MKFSQLYLPTLRDVPKDADNISAKLMVRSGMIRKLAAGLYEWLPLGLRILKKAEKIVREEMNAIGGQEVWLPHIQPKELWEESGRWNAYGKELLRIKDRKNAEFCFAPTAEEVMTDLVRRDVQSYRQLPLMVYQFGTKFRDEIRPRFGVMRAREFYMKDAYSYHADEKDAEIYYARVVEAYQKIFARCGLNFRPVEAETGAIGGSFSHEFMVLAETGEEEIVSCPECRYAANVERAEYASLKQGSKNGNEPVPPVEEVPTPGASSVADVAKVMQAAPDRFIKTLFYMAEDIPVAALLRGDTELNESKLKRALGVKFVAKMSEENYVRYSGSEVGFAGPVGLKEKGKKTDPRFRMVADSLIPEMTNAISGANRKDSHAKNINPGRDFEADLLTDLRNVRRGDFCPRCAKNEKRSALDFSRGIEVGHTFKLGTKYSTAMKATYLDAQGKPQPFVMGCYGIGVSRVVAASIEQQNDANGIIWKKELAPFQVVIVPVRYEDPKIKEIADRIYAELESLGIETLMDDRSERAGVKFKDADLIGVPLRATIGEAATAKNSIELKERTASEAQLIPIEKAVLDIQALIAGG